MRCALECRILRSASDSSDVRKISVSSSFSLLSKETGVAVAKVSTFRELGAEPEPPRGPTHSHASDLSVLEPAPPALAFAGAQRGALLKEPPKAAAPRPPTTPGAAAPIVPTARIAAAEDAAENTVVAREERTHAGMYALVTAAQNPKGSSMQ